MPQVRERIYTWFVEPLDDHTNRVFSVEIPYEDDQLRGERDNRGRPHDLYRVKRDKVDYFLRSKKKSQLRFRVFVREGGGAMRDVTSVPLKPRAQVWHGQKEEAA